MRVRSLSSIGVVVVGLVPALAGGFVFAATMSGLGILAFFEYRALGTRLAGPGTIATSGYAIVTAFSFAPLLTDDVVAVVLIAAAAVTTPFVGALFNPLKDGLFGGWAIGAAGALYLGLPLYGAVALRSHAGSVDAAWFSRLADLAAFGWPAAPRGLAWILIVIVATWIGDTSAYLVGRAWGRRPLLPRVSPRKTVEGSLAGLAGSSLIGALGVVVFGLGLPVGIGLLVGLTVGAVGQVGDLAESLLKRQANVKDSGDLIPGHGGVLDRIDALLFALPTGWFLATMVDRTLW